MNLRTNRAIVFPDLTYMDAEECSTKPGIVFQRDVSAFALQFQAKSRASVMIGFNWQSYLNELVVRYGEINLPVLVESEEL